LYGGASTEFPAAAHAFWEHHHSGSTRVPAITLQVHALDFTCQEDVEAWVNRFGATISLCIHTAALSVPRRCQEDPQKAKDLNVPTALLRGLCQRHHVPIIALSTDQVYDGNNSELYTETSPTHPVNVYGETKLAMEQILQQQDKTPMVILRSSIILGPKAPILPEQTHDTFLHFCQGRIQTRQQTTFCTDEIRSVIATDNVVETILYFTKRILNAPSSVHSEIYNMGGPQQRISRYDMAKAVLDRLGADVDLTLVVASHKAAMPAGPVASPLDISMDSSKLYNYIGDAVTWKNLAEIVATTFPDTAAS
jgi:dTDP-4-dehydrorhamnose reductase